MDRKYQRTSKRIALMNRIREFGIPSDSQNDAFEALPVPMLVSAEETSHTSTAVATTTLVVPPQLVVQTSLNDRDNDFYPDPNENPQPSPGEDHQIGGQHTNGEDSQHITNDEEIFEIPQRIRHPKAEKIAEFVSRHSLGDECLKDLLMLLQDKDMTNCAGGAIKTVYQLNKHIGIQTFKATFLWKCSICEDIIQRSAFEHPYGVSCCGKSIDENASHFVLFDLKEQVAAALNGVNLMKRKSYGKVCEMMESGLMKEDDIMITLNTDGTALFTSSKSSLWPVLATINGLSNQQEKSRVMLMGLWVSKGPGKPDFKLMLERLALKLKSLHVAPIKWTDGSGSERLSKVFVSAVMCDSIARPAVQMMNQFNAEYGCGFCFHKESRHYFSHGVITERTHGEHVALCEQVNEDLIPKFGVISRSPLMDVEYLDIIWDFPIDVMHTVYLGVTDLLTSKWLSPASRGKPYYISEAVRQNIDEFLLSIKPPRRISRLPRSLSQRTSFKAHEWNMWLTYYSPIILQNILPREYYCHWLWLVNGISLLNAKETSLTNETMERAGLLLEDFSRQMETLYDHKTCRFNVHLLRHLVPIVKRFGPLHVFSMTTFETYNAKLKSYVSGSKGPALQIVRRYLRDVLLRDKLGKTTSKSEQLITLAEVSRFQSELLLVESHFMMPNHITYYRQVEYKGKWFNSLCNCKARRRSNNIFWLNTDRVVEVAFFCRSQDNTYAIGNLHEMVFSSLQVNHIYESVSSRVAVVDIDEIDEIGLKMEVNNVVYFSKFINNKECINE